MKKLFIILLALRGVAFAQCNPPTDITVVAVTGNTAQAHFTEYAGAFSTNWYVYKLPARTLVNSGVTFAELFNFTGVVPGGSYMFVTSSNCTGPTVSASDSVAFNIPSTGIVYTPMSAAGYQYKYVQIDSGLAIPFVDSSLFRGINRPGVIICNTSDSVIYSWTGRYWSPFIIGGSSLTSVTKVRYPLHVLDKFDTGAATDSLVIEQSFIDSALSDGGSGGVIPKYAVNIDSTIQYMIDSATGRRLDSISFSGGGLGGSGGSTSLQQAFDQSVTLGDNPTINAHSNDLNLDSINILLSNSKYFAFNSNVNDTSTSYISGDYDGSLERPYIRIYSRKGIEDNEITVGYDNTIFTNSTEGKHTKVIIDKIDTTSTTDYITGFKNGTDELIKIPSPPTISSGSGAPASTPGKVGDIYVDTVGFKLYFSKGTASSADWIIAN